MTSLSHRYPELGEAATDHDDPLHPDNADAADLRLQVFEEGYKAGWDDAAKAHRQDHDRMTAELAQNFDDMAFTYHEALSKLTVAMTPLLVEIATVMLPATLQQALSAQVLAQFQEMVADCADRALTINVAPQNANVLTSILTDKTSSPFSIVADEAIGPGQVYLRTEGDEREINLDRVQETIATAVEAFIQEYKEEPA